MTVTYAGSITLGQAVPAALSALGAALPDIARGAEELM